MENSLPVLIVYTKKVYTNPNDKQANEELLSTIKHMKRLNAIITSGSIKYVVGYFLLIM